MRLGDAAPEFTVTGTSEGGTARIVSGTVRCRATQDGRRTAGSVLNDDRGDGLPQRNGTQQANFMCTMPLQATPENPARASLTATDPSARRRRWSVSDRRPRW